MAVSRPDLTEVSVDGVSYFLSAAADTEAPLRQRSVALLLPGFDEYFLGYRDRSAVIDGAHEQRVVPGKNEIFRPLVVVDGRIVGTWRKKTSVRALRVTPEPFGPLTGRQRSALRRSAGDYRRFLDPNATLEVADADTS